jgi:uncharacterized membrane protein
MRRAGERGAASVVIIGALLIGLAFVGLAVDGARMFTARRDLQNVADAAALAGAGEVDEVVYRDTGGDRVVLDATRARAAVDRVLAASGLPAGTAVAVQVEPDRVRVNVERPVPTTFLRIVSLREQRIGASASASPQTG